ncbi:MFS transporter [Candidatus Solirubrobacter pratensis]|uniref:MFS transporter n=1 Tax=Candidatus Solirubrobacter pratensis TaxID=1298857 RepID=UPI00041EE93F|nr:MFS transporter [Candidatus Solirubrobacter pratensis]
MTHAHASRRWVLGLAAVASFMVALDTLVVSTALTTIRLDLGASAEQLEWTVNAYNLSFAVLLMTASALGDRYGRRRGFAFGLVVFSLASAACALAPGAGTLIAARAVQGAGAAFVMPLALALVGAAFPPERRGAAMGALQGLTGLSVASGPVIGGAIAQGVAWQWIFWINVPIGLLAVPFVLARVKEGFGSERALDLRGLGLVTGAALGVVWGLVRGNQAGWQSAEVVASLAAGLALLVAFVWWEARSRTPMLPLGLFRSRAFSAGNGGIFLTFAALFSAVFFLAQFLQTSLGYGPLGAGMRLLPWTATLFFVAPVAGALVDRYGERPFLAGGLALQALGLAWIALVASPGMSYVELVPALMLAGCGVSMALPSAQNAAVNAVPAGSIGKAAGANSTLRELGGVFGIAIAVAVFTGAGGYTSAQEFSDGFTAAMLVAAGLSLAGALAGLMLGGRRLSITQPLPEGSPS